MIKKQTKKKALSRILCLWIITLLILNSILLIITVDVSAFSTTVTSSSGDVYGVAYGQTRNLARAKNQWIHAAWKQLVSGGYQVYYARTTDNGSTWSTPAALTSIPSTWTMGETSPSIIVDSHQKLWIFFDTKDVAATNNYNISYVSSTDNGTTWSAKTNIYSMQTYVEKSVSTVLDGMDNIHVVFIGSYYGISFVNHVRYIKYTHATTTWSAPSNLTSGVTSSDRAYIEVDDSNNLHVVWVNVNGLSTQQTMYKKYTNATATWGSAIQVSTDQTLNSVEHPVVIANGSYVNVLWYAPPDGDTARRIRSRYYDGASWSATTNITSSLPNHCYTPSVSLDMTGKLYVTFFYNPGTRNIYFSESSDHGATWSSPTAIITDATEDRYPQNIYAMYPKYDTNHTNVPLDGYAFVWQATNAVNYYSSVDLDWQPLVAPTPPPPSPPGIDPEINFITPPSTTNGTKSSTTTCYIRASLNSTSGNYSNIYNNSNETLRPNSCTNTYYIDYTGQNPSAAQCIDDTIADGGEFPTFTGSFIYKAVETGVDASAKWDVPSSNYDPSCIVDSLTYTMTAGTYGATGGTLPVDVYFDLNISNDWYETPTYVQRITTDATWYTFSYTWNYNPSTGLNWTVADINDIHFGMRNHKIGAASYGSLDTTQCYITLNGIHAGRSYTLLNLDDDLLLWMRFNDQTGGQPADISGNSNHGAKQGSAYIDGYGTFGKELFVDGYGDYINIPTSASMDAIDDTATVSLWARSYEDYGFFPQNNRGLFGFYQGADNRLYVCIHKTDQKVEVYNRLGSSTVYKTLTDTTLPGGYITSFHLYTFTFNSSYIACYIDGSYKGRATVTTGTWPSLSALLNGFVTTIGRGSTTGTTWDWFGEIDEFLIFNRQLQSNEILSLYSSSYDTIYFNAVPSTDQQRTILRPTADLLTNIYGAQPPGGTGPHWSVLDENDADNDTSFIYSVSWNTWKNDNYQMQNHTTETEQIKNVTIYYRIKTQGVGQTKAIPSLIIGGIEYNGTLRVTSATSYTLFTDTWTKNPNTGIAWTWADIDNITGGLWMNRYSATTDSRCTQYYIGVNIEPTTLKPTSDYFEQLYPVGATNNYDCVNDVASDGDSTMVSTTSSAPQYDLYGLENVTQTGTINNIRLCIYAERAGVGTGGNLINGLLNIGGTTYSNTAQTLISPYQFYNFTWTTNPATGSSFNWTAINDLKIGVWFDISGLSTYGRCTQIFLTVNGSRLAAQYDHNFTSLPNANYTFQGFVSNSIGALNQTEIRWANLSYPYAPVVSDVSPANNSIAQPYPSLSIKVIDDNNDLMRIYWSTNSTGSWIIRHTDTGVSSGSTNTWTDTFAPLASTDYYWKISVNDSIYNITHIYKFTTMDKYFLLKGLHNGGVDWTGLPGSSYWCNATGSGHETLDINMTIGTGYLITNVGIWAGDLLLTFTDDLTTGLNYVTFPEYAIDSCLNDDPETVLDSIHDYLINVTEVTTGKYWNRTGTPTLLHILPALQYSILVNDSCQIYISSPVRLNASNVSVQFSSNNITWGINTRSFIDGGSVIRANASTWTNANGCYGLNPFPISPGTTNIYARFKINLPSNLPSDYIYLSLSSSGWKVYIYSGTPPETDPTIPPATPTIPTSGDFLLKWVNSTLPFFGFDEPVTKDIDDDGIMEIFWAGCDHSTTPTVQYLMCVNSSTGAARWSNSWGNNLDVHNPLTVYDFDKDGDDEVFMTRNTGGSNRFMLFDAATGSLEWNVSSGAPGSVQHHMGYIDNGDVVYIYTAGSDEVPPYDAKICKINGYNGTTVKTASTYYSCYGGTSIGDLDGDGKYEVIITDRGQDKYPGTPAKSVRCYDEDLNLLWYATYPTCSSHCAMLIDVNGDGKLEVVIGRQNSGNSGLYVFNYDGSIWNSSAIIPGWYMHVQPSVGDIDGDGHIEMIDGYSSYWNIFDLTDWAIEYTIPTLGYPTPTIVSEPPDIGNVILDANLEVDNRPEIIACRGDYPYIVKYNYTTGIYETVYRFGSSVGAYNNIVTDFDHDGFNEMLLSTGSDGTRKGTMRLYETKVPSEDPLPRTGLAHDGERRLSNGLYYPPPYTGSDLYSELGFGGTANLTGYSAELFISDCTSRHDRIELNGYYSLGNYSTLINTTLYLPSPWTLNSMYIRLINATSGVQYDNLTYGFYVTGLNATHKIYTRNYNPSIAMDGIKNITADVHVSINYGGVVVFSGNKTFPGLFKIYDIDGPIHGSSKYNTTTNALNLTWSAGNYTDVYVVVRKTGVTYPSSPLDGTIVQNNTHLYYVEAGVLSSRAYSIFGYNRTTRSFSEALNIPWGGIRLDVHDENNATKRIRFKLLVSNRNGSQTYTKTNIIGPYYLDLLDIPYGPQTIFIISNTTYRQRTYYEDLYANTFYNFSFYLPPVTPGGGSTPEENNTQLYLLTVYNRYGQTLQDVSIDVRRYINTTDSYESVGILLTDAAGQADIFLIPYKLYQFVVSKEGFVTSSNNYWTPTLLIQTHTFILDYEITTENETIDPYDVITFTAGFSLDNVTLSIDVVDSTDNLTDAGVYIYENGTLIFWINFTSAPFHIDYTNNATSPNNNLHEYLVVLTIRNHSQFPSDPYNFTILIQRNNPHGLLLNVDIDLTGILGDPGGGAGVHIGWINVFICGLGVFIIVSFGRYWAGIGIAAMGLVIGLIEFSFGIPGFTGIQLVSFIAYCIIMGSLVEIGKAKQGKVGF